MFLGIDVGTGGTRAVLVDRAGRVVASAASEHAPIHSEQIGWAEQQPEDWWRAAREAIAGAIAAAELDGAEIQAVGLDRPDARLRPARRRGRSPAPRAHLVRPAHPAGVRLARSKDRPRARLIELTCNPALPNFTLTKLLWVRTHQPEIFARIAHVLCPKDYVRYRLTGEFAIDMQEASGTLLLDVAHRRWSAEVAEAAGIPHELAAASL